jgi:hypothetical protein
VGAPVGPIIVTPPGDPMTALVNGCVYSSKLGADGFSPLLQPEDKPSPADAMTAERKTLLPRRIDWQR